jgi:hypothetical protein
MCKAGGYKVVDKLERRAGSKDAGFALDVSASTNNENTLFSLCPFSILINPKTDSDICSFY